MRKLILIVIVASSMSFVLKAQTDVDALRYSQLTFGGTARGMGVCGAFGALGADMTSLSSNPAGLGVYRSSEFVLTPAIYNIKTTTNYIGNSGVDYKYNFNFSNFGLVVSKLHTDSKGNIKQSGFVTTNFAFASNRLASFHGQFFIEGFNEKNSLLDRYVQDANAAVVGPSGITGALPFTAGMGYQAYLINPDPADTFKYTSVVPNGRVLQRQSIETRGALDEFLLSFGANYDNKIYMGASIGIPSIRYRQKSNYSETDTEDTIAVFESFSLEEHLETNGLGINLKLGLIYRINDFIRIGGAIHTPTYMSLTDNFYSSISSDLDTLQVTNYLSPDGSYNYSLTTPWRLIGSLGFILKKLGFFSVEYEFVNYGQAFYRFKTGSTADKLAAQQINTDIQVKYGPAHNIRMGAEAKYKIFRFRAGFAFYTTPFDRGYAAPASDNHRRTVSAGFGIRQDEYFIDFAYARTTVNEYYAPYTLDNESTQGTVNKIAQNNFLLTLGARF